jgi:hypothetical protein
MQMIVVLLRARMVIGKATAAQVIGGSDEKQEEKEENE